MVTARAVHVDRHAGRQHERDHVMRESQPAHLLDIDRQTGRAGAGRKGEHLDRQYGADIVREPNVGKKTDDQRITDEQDDA